MTRDTTNIGPHNPAVRPIIQGWERMSFSSLWDYRLLCSLCILSDGFCTTRGADNGSGKGDNMNIGIDMSESAVWVMGLTVILTISVWTIGRVLALRKQS